MVDDVPRSAWSERFIAANTNGVGYSFVVPDGKRAVIMSVTLCAGSTAAADAEVSAGGIYIVRGSVPGKETRHWTGMRVAVYAGQSISVFTPTANAYIGVFGYLLEDDMVAGLLAVEQLPAASSEQAMQQSATAADES